MIAGRGLTLHLIVLAVLAATLRGQEPATRPPGTDDALAAARRFVEKSDRYLHHSRLKRGMKGYGLTVMAGTKPVRFAATIVSVVARWGPGRYVILARLAGQNLENTGVIAGMSGSPVYMTDSRDGKVKMIGAVAYGWRGQKEALCGIQPITQMLAIPGVLPGKKPATTVASKGSALTVPPGVIAAVLDPKKIDFSTLAMPTASRAGAAMAGDGQFAPLATPLMISAGSGRLLAALRRRLGAMGIIPLQAGGVMMGFKAPRPDRLAPGSAVSVPLVAGDADWSAVGTVTDVIGDRVLAFGHGFYSDGQTRLPMGPAYVHTVISSILDSFKLSSTLGRTGVLDYDSNVGISGRIGQGQKLSMIPMTVALDWKVDGRKQTYRYRIVRHRWLTPMLVSMLLKDAAASWRNLPEFHTVRYQVNVDFGKLGRYSSTNVSSGDGVRMAVSDASRPIVAMLTNQLGPAPKLLGVDVKISIAAGQTRARILDFKLDGRVYRPGETVTGVMIVRAFRRKREKIALSFKLPDDLPEGSYSLAVCDDREAMRRRISEMPQRFDPRTVEELFAEVKEVVQLDASKVYLRLPLHTGGLALGRKELPDLPQSRMRIITEAGQLDTAPFSKTLVRSVQTAYVLNGSAEAAFTVRTQPRETRLKNPKK